ncbi:MAG TPA: endonuclease III [Gemmatimonadales bacterium]|nr:endonuclease III [Gemmatimonadales bacterium]
MSTRRPEPTRRAEPGGKRAARRKSGTTSRPRPRRESAAALGERAATILARLKAAYPDAHCALDHADAYQLLVATILSAQCTDARVNQVTPKFFARYRTPEELARADQSEVEELIRSTGFFRNKARSLIGMARAVVADHAGDVPRTMEELRDLPGVGRKTANVVLGNAYGINEGVTVDTHVTRLSRLLGLTRHDDPVRIEQDLMPLFPREEWALLSHLLIFHGRQVCVARRPRCPDCVVADLCPSAAV